jgi:hypothetical protein
MDTGRVDDLVAAWLAGGHTMFDAVHDEPEAAWPSE